MKKSKRIACRVNETVTDYYCYLPRAKSEDIPVALAIQAAPQISSSSYPDQEL